ncbi:hypothetical protein B7463_g3265, partial [Scytalidium lignicola]
MEEFNLDRFMTLNAVAEVDHLPLSLWDNSVIPGQTLLEQQQQQQQAPSHRLRTYRPRNPRSCDFCRARKTACRVEDDPPCATCKLMGKECTFAERPRKRKRQHRRDVAWQDSPGPVPIPTAQENTPSPGETSRKSMSLHSDSSMDERPVLWRTGTSQVAVASGTKISDIDNIERHLARNGRDCVFDGSNPDDSYSLDLRPTSTAFLLGDTGESDPYLIKSSRFLSARDQGAATKIGYCRIYREGYAPNDHDLSMDNDKPLVFMFGQHSLHDRYEPRVEDEVLQKTRLELEDMCSDEVGIRLINLYFKYVYPYFPVLSRSQMFLSEQGMNKLIRKLPLSLKSVLYATGLPFMVYDDVLSTTLDLASPSAHRLYRIAWLAISHEIHTPHLSTLQACLLLLQRVNDDRYVMDSPFRWSCLAWTYSGVGEEIEKEALVGNISPVDFVCDPDKGHQDEDDDKLHENSHFYHLVELSIILSDIIDSYFSIRASKTTASNFALTLDLAKPIRSRLQSWKESFHAFALAQQSNPGDRTRLDGNASLGLLYPVAVMILFRALLRPLETTSGSHEDKLMRENGREAVRVGAKACCVEVVQYLEEVKRGVWDAFWHSWSRAGFAIASSFMIRLLITSTSSEETEELNRLVIRWRWALRSGGGNAGNVLTSLGLLRLDRSLLETGIHKSQDDA